MCVVSIVKSRHMKTKRLLITALILVSFLLINATTDHKKLSESMIEQSVVKISPNLYACKYETSNWLYLQFLTDLKKNNSAEDLKIAQVDTAEWTSTLHYNEPFVKYYLRHPAFADYPVVNISYEGANLFCKWLTDKYNTIPNRKYKNVVFRLPTEQEWVLAAKGGLPNPIYSCGDTLRDKTGEYMCNYHMARLIDNGGLNDYSDITGPVKNNPTNGFGIYNMSGNVAELISEKGITKGGSWRTDSKALQLDAKGTYEKAACDIGFRYFMEVKGN